MGGNSGGGGGVQEVNTTVTNTNIPQEFYPYLQKSLQQADALLQQDYIPYEGQRVAAYTPEQQAAFQGITGLASRSLPGIDDARSFVGSQLVDPTTGIPKGASVTDATASYTAPTTGPSTFTPGTVSSTYTAPASFASGYAGREVASGYAPGTIASGYAPGTIASGYQGREIASTYRPGTIRSGFTEANVGTDYTGTQFTRPDLASRIAEFQNPFQQQVLDVAQERAERAFNTQQAQRGLQATRAGGASAFGARGALANLEAERGFRDRQAATEADLLLKGFDKATATALADIDRGIRTQELTDASRRAAAGLDLQGQIATGRFAQAAGAQGLQAAQLTDAARRAAGAQDLQAAQLSDAASRAAGAQGLQAAIASDAAARAGGAQTLQGLIASDAAQRAKGAQGLQAAQLSDVSKRAAGEQALRALFAADSSAQKAGDQALRAALASEDLKAKGGEQAIRAFSALEQAGQTAGAQGLQAAIANQRALAQEKARLDTLARFGINVDAQEQALDLQRIGALQAAGADLRADQQRILDADYQDFLRQRDFPRDQLAFYSNILRGAQSGPMDRTVTQAQPPANQAGQLFNFLLGAAALNRAA